MEFSVTVNAGDADRSAGAVVRAGARCAKEYILYCGQAELQVREGEASHANLIMPNRSVPLILGASALFAIPFAMGAFSPVGTVDVITAKTIRLVDDNGKMRGRFGLGEREEVSFKLFDSQERCVVELFAFDEGAAGLFLHGKNANGAVSLLWGEEQGASLAIHPDIGSEMLELALGPNGLNRLSMVHSEYSFVSIENDGILGSRFILSGG